MTTLRPFWRYYGGKWRNAPHYPAPEHDTIVEPFAGAAGYSTRHHRRRVILVDKSPIIAGIWRYLIDATPEEIRRLPDIPEGGTTDDMDAPQEVRWLAGFWCNNGAAAPCKSPSKWVRRSGAGSKWGGWNNRSRERIASQVGHIKHWQIIEGEYWDAPDIEATWHVDPPYANRAGSYYKHQPADFAALGDWCRTRRGLVMVCENEGADWLPFDEIGEFAANPGHRAKGRTSREVVWLNREPAGQMVLFG